MKKYKMEVFNIWEDIERYCNKRNIEISTDKLGRMYVLKSDNIKHLQYIKNYYLIEYNIKIEKEI